MVYSDKINIQIQSTLFDFNMQRIDGKHIAGYDPRTRQLTYVFNGQQVFYVHIDSTQDLKQIYEQCCYDICNTSEWKLQNLHKHITQHLQNTDFNPSSLQLVLLDSTLSVKEAYPARHSFNRIPSTPECDIQLGFIIKDHLYAYYTYPFSLFCREAGDRVLTVLCLFVIIVLCVAILYKTIKREKREAYYRESYVHSIVHDLKSPIANQIALQETLLPTLSGPYKSIAESGLRQMRATLRSVNRMLLQSTDAHGLKLKKERFDLRESLQSLARPEQWPAPRGKRFQITVDYKASSPLFLGDPNFLHAVFCNFIDNSLKYSGPQVDIRVTCEDAAPGRLRITFADNGDGISPAAQKRVFDRYNRGDHQNDPSTKGHGQGLHYARLVVKAHGGTIKVESAPGCGTRFIVTLPDNDS